MISILGYTYTLPMYKFGQTSSTGFRSSLHVSRIFSNSLIGRSPCLFFWAVILLNWPRSDFYAREDAFLLFSRGVSIHNGLGTPWSTQTGALYDAVRSPDTTEHLRAPLMIEPSVMFTSSRGRLVAQKVKNIAFKSSSDVFIVLEIFLRERIAYDMLNIWIAMHGIRQHMQIVHYDISLLLINETSGPVITNDSDWSILTSAGKNNRHPHARLYYIVIGLNLNNNNFNIHWMHNIL